MAFLFYVLLPFAATAIGLFVLLKSYGVSTKHLCLQCQYDLHGLPTSRRCPECGAELNGSNTIVPGQPITHWWRIVVGSILYFAGSVALACGFIVFVVVMFID